MGFFDRFKKVKNSREMSKSQVPTDNSSKKYISEGGRDEEPIDELEQERIELQKQLEENAKIQKELEQAMENDRKQQQELREIGNNFQRFDADARKKQQEAMRKSAIETDLQFRKIMAEDDKKTISLIMSIYGDKESKDQVELYLKSKNGEDVKVPERPFRKDQLEEITKSEELTEATKSAIKLQSNNEIIKKCFKWCDNEKYSKIADVVKVTKELEEKFDEEIPKNIEAFKNRMYTYLRSDQFLQTDTLKERLSVFMGEIGGEIKRNKRYFDVMVYLKNETDKNPQNQQQKETPQDPDEQEM